MESLQTVGLRIFFENVTENGESVKIDLICQQNQIEPIIKNVIKNGSTYSILIFTEKICPREIRNTIIDFFSKFKWIIFFFGVAIGPMELFVGSKIFSITVLIIGFLFC